MKLYKKIITYKEIKDKSLDEILLEISIPIIKRNRENNWIDDNFNDILYAFEEKYKLDISEYDLLYDKIRNLIKTI